MVTRICSDVEEQLASDSWWIVKWNNFLSSLKRTIKDDEPVVVHYKKEDLEAIESIREIVDVRKLFSYLKENQIDHRRAWVFQFEKSMNEILKLMGGRFNCPHYKSLENQVVDKYEYEIEFINERRETFSIEDMRDIPDTLKELMKFYTEYKTRIIDYEMNLEYRKKYFIVRKEIEQIPKEYLFSHITWDNKVWIFVGEKYRDAIDKLWEKIGFKIRCYELDESVIERMNLGDLGMYFVYCYIPYYDFYYDASLTEAIYRNGYESFVDDRAIVDAFEDDGRMNYISD